MPSDTSPAPSAVPVGAAPPTPDELAAAVEALQADGIVARREAFPRAWGERLHADILAAFEEARSREGGAVGRGPQRWYVEIHPEQLAGFVDLVSHPWVAAVSEAVLGPDYEIVEIGFDVPFPGARNQPWHRDFPAPPQTYEQRRITSLAFNLTAVDTTPEMGPFEIAPGTQYEAGLDWDHRMFPPQDEWPRFAAGSRAALPRLGDVSARSALTVHRGTANRSDSARPVLVLGVDAPGAGHAELHDLMVTRAYWDTLPDAVRAHLHARVVDELVPIVQKHTIEGLVMGAP
jgi:ectoine hydroxylase-related dioxygenase (phytanoyl-CoA dioxygenase family)